MFNKVGTICGIIGLLVSVFGWLGVSPETVGQAAYDALYIALPIISGVLGIFTGWCLHGLLTDSEAAKAAAVERARQDGETDRLRMNQEYEEAERQREIDNRKKKAEKDRRYQIAVALSKLGQDEKRALKAMMGHGEICFSRSYIKGCKSKEEYGWLLSLCDQVVDGDIVRYTPLEKATEVYKCGQREFDLISDGDLEDNAVYDTEKRKIPQSHGAYDHITWWFYTDDPDFDRDAAWEKRLRLAQELDEGEAKRTSATKSTGGNPIGVPQG